MGGPGGGGFRGGLFDQPEVEAGKKRTGNIATGLLSAISTETQIGDTGFSFLDPLQIGPSLFDSPEAPPSPKPPPPPPDETIPLFREIARAETDRRLRSGRGSLGSFQRRT